MVTSVQHARPSRTTNAEAHKIKHTSHTHADNLARTGWRPASVPVCRAPTSCCTSGSNQGATTDARCTHHTVAPTMELPRRLEQRRPPGAGRAGLGSPTRSLTANLPLEGRGTMHAELWMDARPYCCLPVLHTVTGRGAVVRVSSAGAACVCEQAAGCIWPCV